MSTRNDRHHPSQTAARVETRGRYVVTQQRVQGGLYQTSIFWNTQWLDDFEDVEDDAADMIFELACELAASKQARDEREKASGNG